MDQDRSNPPPTISKDGQQKGRDAQRHRADQFNDEVFTHLILAVHQHSARTLKQMATVLNGLGVRTARGDGSWTEGLVHYALKRRGLSAKELIRRVTTAPVTELPDEPSLAAYKRWGDALRELQADGEWVRLIHSKALKADLVRHPKWGEGQFISERKGKVTCWFYDKGNTVTVHVPAAEIEVFKHRLSREGQIAKSEWLSKTILSKS